MCHVGGMSPRRLEDLLVYQKALSGVRAVSALLLGGTVRKECHGQLVAAATAVPANIAEGFGQQSDRQFVRFLAIARGSAQEVRAHLAAAEARKEITVAEFEPLADLYEEIAKMLTALMHYLRASDLKDRR